MISYDLVLDPQQSNYGPGFNRFAPRAEIENASSPGLTPMHFIHRVLYAMPVA